MVISISQQGMLVLLSLFCGILTGVFFDVYRIIRGIETPNKIVSFIGDILFWIFTALVVFIFLSLYDYAYIEIYVFLLITLGTGFYFKFLSIWVIMILNRGFKVMGKIMRILKNFICFPFQVIIYYIFRKHK